MIPLVLRRIPLPCRIWRAAADLASLGVLACGLSAAIASPYALILITVAGLLDGVDGALARRAGGPSVHGAQLDVIADFAAFGIPVAVLMLTVRPSLAALIGAVIFLSAALYRLLRAYQRAHCRPAYFTGLPMPAAGGLLAGLVMILPPFAVFAAVLLVSALAVSRKPYPTVSHLWRTNRLLVLAVVAITLGLFAVSYPVGLVWIGGVSALYPWLQPRQSV